MHWQPSEELLKELRDLAQHRDEMAEDLLELLDELAGAAEASVGLRLPMLFSWTLTAGDAQELACHAWDSLCLRRVISSARWAS
jgi:hypothetical protein